MVLLCRNSSCCLIAIFTVMISGITSTEIQYNKKTNNLTDGSKRFADSIDVLQEIYSMYTAFKSDINYNALLDTIITSSNISGTCAGHLNMTLNGLADKEIWAFLMLDAMGKPGPGILVGKITWTGAYQQCLDVRATRLQQVRGTNQSVMTHYFNGRYCTVGFPLIQMDAGQEQGQISPYDLSIGVCVPDSCSAKDIKALVDYAVNLIPSKFSNIASDVICQQDHIEYDVKAISCIAFMGVLMILMCIGTAFDMVVVHKLHKRKVSSEPEIENPTSLVRSLGEYPTYGSTSCNGGDNAVKHNIQETSKTYCKLSSALVSFSLYTNGSKLLSTKQSAGTLTSLNGIRVISMSWVILGHTWLMVLPMDIRGTSSGAFPSVATNSQRIGYLAVINASLAVDSFFVLSGLLVAYLSLKKLHKLGDVKRFPLGMFYYHRYWRLTPPMMLIIFVLTTTSKYWYNGPFWNQQGYKVDNCQQRWWIYLFYISNFYQTSGQCMGDVWYLANDMQFYILSPLVFVSLYLNVYIGVMICVLVLIGSSTITAVYAYDHNVPISWFGGGGSFNDYSNTFDQLYVRPYCRIGPYIIGMLIGYLLYKTDCKPQLTKWINLIGWIIAAVCCLSIVYGDYGTISGSTPCSNGHIIALYWGMKRFVWSVGLGWVIYACATGYGGLVNTFLSWRLYVPLSRMTYMAYLLNPIVIYVYNRGRRTPIDVTYLNMIYFFIGHLVLSFFGAFVVSLVFESPFMGLESVFLKKKESN